MDRQVNKLEKKITLWHRQNEASRKLADIPGIGPITASAIVARTLNSKYNDYSNEPSAPRRSRRVERIVRRE